MTGKHELVRKIYDAFNARKINEVLAALHPDVDWPNGMEGGRLKGREAVRDYWRRQWVIIDPHVEPIRIGDDDAGRTIVDVHSVVHDLSRKLLRDEMIQHVYVIENALILSMQIQEVLADSRS